MKRRYAYITLSLLISLFIYLFYRTEKTLVNEIASRIISLENYLYLRANIVRLMPLNQLIIYSLPEGLWVFCITLTSKSYYLKLYRWRLNGVVIPLIFSFGLEILQLFHITNGRFDFMDILISLIFWLAGKYILNEKVEKLNILAQPNPKTMVCLGTYCIVYLAHVFK